MLQHHRHNGAPDSTSRRRRRSHLHQTSSRSVPEVGIIPGNRFFLLPLKKVTALVRPHASCWESSATKTKPCIVSKPKQASSQGSEILRESGRESLLQEFNVRSQAHSKSSRLIAKQRRRRIVVAKTRLSPVCEQASVVAEQELLLECERMLWNDGRLVDTRNCRVVGVSNRSRAKDTSIFTMGETTLLESYRGASLAASSTKMLPELNLDTATKKNKKKKRSSSFPNASEVDLVLYQSSRKTHTKSRSFSVSTSRERECLVSSGGRSFGRNNRVSPSSLVSHGHQQLHPEFGPGRNNSATSFGKADDLLETPSGNKNTRSNNPRATSFGKADDLETPSGKKKRSNNPRATSFGKADDLETPSGNKKRSNSRATSFGKADEFVTPRNNKNSLSKSRDNFNTTSTMADELLVPQLETPWNQDRSNFRDNCSTTSLFDKGDELVKLCDKNRRKSRSHRRTSFGKGDEILIRDKKKRRNFSFGGFSHQIRSCSPFLCSFTNKNDLPVGPSPLQLSRRSQNRASVAQGEI